MNSDKAGYRVLVSAIFYKTYDFSISDSDKTFFSCQAGIDNRSMREGKEVRFPIPESGVIEKYKLYDMIITFSCAVEVMDKIKINSRLYLWSGMFIGEAVVKEIIP